VRREVSYFWRYDPASYVSGCCAKGGLVKVLSFRLLLVLLIVIVSQQVFAQSYDGLELFAGRKIYVFGINNSGKSVGKAGIAPEYAYLWSPTGVSQNLGSLGGKFTTARSINNLDQVVGNSQVAKGSSVYHAFLWTDAGGMQDLGTLGGNSVGYAINDHSQVAGAFASGASQHAFLWTAADGMQDLGTLGGDFSQATGINNNGHVVGTAALSNGQRRAFLWTAADGMKELDLGLNTPSGATAINDSDQVVGSFINPTHGMEHAFLWDPLNGARDLGALSAKNGVPASEASAINNAADVVGISLVFKPGNPHAAGSSVIWRHGGAPLKLASLVTPKPGNLPGAAVGINASGQIVANGGGAWLLTPR
jgi:probable HAF family extracellular repeat protein